jgi:nitroreductase
LDFDAVVRRRRMVRSFGPTPIADDVLRRVLRAGLRAPSAGNTQGTDLVVLNGPEQTARYWDVTLPADRRPTFPWPGLLQAPVLVIPLASPGAYIERYREPDKAASGLGEGADAWTVPYWFVDTAFMAMLIQLAAVDEGLGALFFGIFDHTDALMAALSVPASHRAIGTIALGHPDEATDRPSGSSARERRTLDQIVHLGGW